MATLLEVTREDIVEALMHHNDTLKRMPGHWVERRANVHDRLNDLLTQLEQWDRAHGQARLP